MATNPNTAERHTFEAGKKAFDNETGQKNKVDQNRECAYPRGHIGKEGSCGCHRCKKCGFGCHVECVVDSHGDALVHPLRHLAECVDKHEPIVDADPGDDKERDGVEDAEHLNAGHDPVEEVSGKEAQDNRQNTEKGEERREGCQHKDEDDNHG